MTYLDRTTAKALVEAGYMPLSAYIEMYGAAAEHETEAPLVPDLKNDQIGPVRAPSRVNHH